LFFLHHSHFSYSPSFFVGSFSYFFNLLSLWGTLSFLYLPSVSSLSLLVLNFTSSFSSVSFPHFPLHLLRSAMPQFLTSLPCPLFLFFLLALFLTPLSSSQFLFLPCSSFQFFFSLSLSLTSFSYFVLLEPDLESFPPPLSLSLSLSTYLYYLSYFSFCLYGYYLSYFLYRLSLFLFIYGFLLSFSTYLYIAVCLTYYIDCLSFLYICTIFLLFSLYGHIPKFSNYLI
jgi:hypothetical protein